MKPRSERRAGVQPHSEITGRLDDRMDPRPEPQPSPPRNPAPSLQLQKLDSAPGGRPSGGRDRHQCQPSSQGPNHPWAAGNNARECAGAPHAGLRACWAIGSHGHTGAGCVIPWLVSAAETLTRRQTSRIHQGHNTDGLCTTSSVRSATEVAAPTATTSAVSTAAFTTTAAGAARPAAFSTVSLADVLTTIGAATPSGPLLVSSAQDLRVPSTRSARVSVPSRRFGSINPVAYAWVPESFGSLIKSFQVEHPISRRAPGSTMSSLEKFQLSCSPALRTLFTSTIDDSSLSLTTEARHVVLRIFS